MKKILLFTIFLVAFYSCGNEKNYNYDSEKSEVDLFIQKWIGFNYSMQIDKVSDIFVNSDQTTYINPENNPILKGYKSIHSYYKEKFKEFDAVEYNIWDKSIWFNENFSTVCITLMANKKIKLKNGFTIEIQNIRTSVVLIKDPKKWKVISIHESKKIQ